MKDLSPIVLLDDLCLYDGAFIQAYINSQPFFRMGAEVALHGVLLESLLNL